MFQMENRDPAISDERLRPAAAAYDSPYGKIVSEWKYEEGKVKYHVEIPTNMCAEILIDGREKMRRKQGHRIVGKINHLLFRAGRSEEALK